MSKIVITADTDAKTIMCSIDGSEEFICNTATFSKYQYEYHDEKRLSFWAELGLEMKLNDSSTERYSRSWSFDDWIDSTKKAAETVIARTKSLVPRITWTLNTGSLANILRK